MSIELKPCPFCGGRASVYDWQTAVGIGCSDENCPGSMLSEWCFTTKYDAAEAWNTRAERTCKNVHKEWEKTSFAHAGTSFCCSECGAHYVDCESYYAALAGADEEHIRTNYCPNCGAKVVE